MADYYFHTRKLTIGYQKTPLLRDITVGIGRGEILTLIGPNGAGKSTLLKSIAGQLASLGGEIYLERQRLSEIPAGQLARKVAVVFTDKLYTELMTCEDVVAGGRYPYTGRFGLLSDEDWQIVEQSMEMTNVSEIRGREYGKISDGQKQRVLLARALCQQPEMILLDEPTSHLDIRHKLEFLSTLQRLTREQGLSVIMSLHELDLARKVSDRILCLSERGVERFGTPEEIFAPGYLTALFGIGAGSLEEESGDLELPAPEGEPQVFVLAGCGKGRDVFRRLQRAGVPFAAGILYRHDLDYPVARALSAYVVAVESEASFGEAQYEEAKRLMERCGRVILCRERFGEWERENRRLCEYAGNFPRWEEKW